MNTKYSAQTVQAMCEYYGFALTGDSQVDKAHASDNLAALTKVKRDYPPRKIGLELEPDSEHEARLIAMIFGE